MGGGTAPVPTCTAVHLTVRALEPLQVDFTVEEPGIRPCGV